MSDFKFLYWPTEYRKITQHFGANPRNYSQFGLPGHEGLDLRAPSGSRIFCVAPGTVSQVYTRPTGHNYGIHVRVVHQDGYQTIYAHLQKELVSKGEQVKAGTILGLADNTGNSFGSHLHLTLKKEGAQYGRYPANIIDPTPFLLPLMGWNEPAGPFINGWVLAAGVIRALDLAQANPGGVTLRTDASQSVLVPEGTIMIVTGTDRDGYTPVKVPRAAVGMEEDDLPTTPAPKPPPTVSTINGWIWAEMLNLYGDQGIVNAKHGVNMRFKPDQEATNIGVVRRGSTVTILARATNQYLPVSARRIDFIGDVNMPMDPPDVPDHFLDFLPEGIYLGWAQTRQIQISGSYATARHGGVNIQSKPNSQGTYIGTVKGDATITIAGPDRNAWTPILVHESDLFGMTPPLPETDLPDPFPDNSTPIVPIPHPPHDTHPGWVFSGDLTVSGDHGVVGPHGVALRAEPRRDGVNLGFIPAAITVLITGAATGEFTPVRVDEDRLQPATDPLLDAPGDGLSNPDPGSFGAARLGLHASADPHISDSEHLEFDALRPGIIKVLSFHNPADIAKLAKDHPNASWVVRAFLDFGDQHITPQQFLDSTLSDVRRTLNQLSGRDVVVELHNEPNLVAEGLGRSWQDAASFNKWWLVLLSLYRRAIPGARFIFPGLSPGSSVTNIKQDHIQFIEGCREAVEAADGLGVHLYWSNVAPLDKALDVLDDYISRFRFRPIWVTEASNNKKGTPVSKKAQQYLEFWRELQLRPLVQGVTFFVASASDPDFAEEIWVGRGIGGILGRR